MDKKQKDKTFTPRGIYHEFMQKMLLLRKRQNDLIKEYTKELGNERIKQIRKDIGLK